MIQSKSLCPGATYQHQAGNDVFRWSNRDLPKNKLLVGVYILGIVALLPTAVFLTYLLIRDIQNTPPGAVFFTGGTLFAILMILLSWAGVVGLIYILLRLTWIETVLLTDEAILVQYDGLLAWPEKRIPIDKVWKMSFERYRFNKDRESRYTINIMHERRETLAYWMRYQESYQLFQALASIVRSRGWEDFIMLADLNNREAA